MEVGGKTLSKVESNNGQKDHKKEKTLGTGKSQILWDVKDMELSGDEAASILEKGNKP